MSVPQIRTPQEILLLAKISEYLAYADAATQSFFKGGLIDNRLPLMISAERRSVEWKYDYAPSDSTLQGTANYLFGLLGKYAGQAQTILDNLDQTAPVVTGADNESVEDGQQVIFSIGVTSTLPYTIAWYKNGVLIPGETGTSYSFTASLSDDGNTYYAIATNAAGSTQSQSGTLTVTQTIQGFAYYGDTDYYTDLSNGIDNITYQITFPITNAQPLQITFPSGAANNKYEVIKYPISQGLKTNWKNTDTNLGILPDSTFRSILTIGSYYYIVSRTAISIDTTSSPNMTFS